MTVNYNRIHFIGIGGTGMSGIAKILMNMGYTVSGSDLKVSEALLRLKEAGAKVFIGHHVSNVEGADLVVVSSAIPKSNPEYVKAIESNIPVVHRADMLSLLMDSKKGIAVSGAHGKTTTTSMISLIMEKNGFDPTVIIGGELNDIGGNATLGNGEFLVAEADESDGSFMKLKPYVAVITNIENDHMDYYKNMENMKNAFKAFVSNVKQGGFVVVGNDNEYVREMIKDIDKECYTFGMNYKSDFMPKNIRMNGLSSSCDIYFRGKFLGELQLNVPGLHNIVNATAAVAVGNRLGIDIEGMREAIKTFHGVQRRFQIIDEIDGIKVIDDYGHHPTEIKATLRAARSCNPRKIYAIFQPHRYTRTQNLAGEFGSAFIDADEVILTDIYSAGERPINGVSSELIAESLKENGKKVVLIKKKEDIPDYIIDKVFPGDFILTIGAGDINDIAYKIVNKLKSCPKEVIGNIPEVN
ncbi:MAG TPA: UDP-N-acetylmuramate--L-alanine ligase [Thermoanaerobacterales bacterium]|nr:UDP-N-acetylmuramate--L-alanine ligase [Tepidanaerobacter sp. GT38]MCG1012168.1 UDP-N-acetylmuramate--L-alanine ligase [Tepidanaerobacter sp. GT38]HHY42372.1 UDP-N-acetylmuramate--L-alanine ligase [Thermoanaerobacterales bacterium]